MPNPKLIQEIPLTLVDVKESLQKIEKQDKELNYRSNKVNEYISLFVHLSKEKKKELNEKLIGLNSLRLKEAHIAKIIDFLPKTIEELKVILQAYTVSMPKKEMEGIIATVKEVIK